MSDTIHTCDLNSAVALPCDACTAAYAQIDTLTADLAAERQRREEAEAALQYQRDAIDAYAASENAEKAAHEATKRELDGLRRASYDSDIHLRKSLDEARRERDALAVQAAINGEDYQTQYRRAERAEAELAEYREAKKWDAIALQGRIERETALTAELAEVRRKTLAFADSLDAPTGNCLRLLITAPKEADENE